MRSRARQIRCPYGVRKSRDAGERYPLLAFLLRRVERVDLPPGRLERVRRGRAPQIVPHVWPQTGSPRPDQTREEENPRRVEHVDLGMFNSRLRSDQGVGYPCLEQWGIGLATVQFYCRSG